MWQQQQQSPDPPLLEQRHHSSPMLSSSCSAVRTAAVPTSSVGNALLPNTPLWNRRSLTSPTKQSLRSESLANVAAPLLLSRSIRETTLHRVEGKLSRTASNYAQSGDDTDDTRSAVSPAEMPDVLVKDGNVAGGNNGPAASASCQRLASPSSPGSSKEATMSFESLWNNIDRYLFAVYTTLQTGDESSLRPLRTPRHRMGWYTVIYNACSGDPAKSRELYTRLALLLLHLLESHVLFPILQNVDHSRIQFLTGAEDAVVAAIEDASPRLGASGSVTSAQTPQQQQQQQAPSGGSFSSWVRFRSIAAGSGGGASFGEQARGAQSKDTSRNSSFHGSVSSLNTAVNTTTTSRNNSTANTSYAFIRRFFQPSHHTTSPLVSLPNDDAGDESGIAEGGRQLYSPGMLPLPPASTDGAGVFARGDGSSSSPAAASSSELRTAFEGFDSTVYRNRSCETAAAARGAGLNISTSLSPTTPACTLGRRRSPCPIVSHQSTARTVSHTAPGTSASFTSSSSSCVSSPTTDLGQSNPTTTTPSAAVAHHARVASSTGRVLVNDEEEVLCEANTVASDPQHPKRVQRSLAKKQPTATSAAASSKAGSPPQQQLSANASSHIHVSRHDDDDASLHTMNSSLSSPNLSHENSTQMSALTGASTGVFQCDQRRNTSSFATMDTTTTAALERRGLPRRHAGPSRFPDDETNEMSAMPSANFFSPSSASLSSAEDAQSPLLSTNPSTAVCSPTTTIMAGAAAAHDDAATATTSTSASTAPLHPVLTITVAPGTTDVPTLPELFVDTALSGPSPLEASRPVSALTTPVSNDSAGRRSSATPLSRQTSSSNAGLCYTRTETTVPANASAATQSLASLHDSPLYDGDHHNNNSVDNSGGDGRYTGDTPAAATTTTTDQVGSNAYGGRRFSLCYTFIQEWQTFLIFRGVVLSCFRYLDQYYTRRYGMDTITLMCFKVFYVAVYEPLHPLLVLELRYLTQYVREVFEATSEVAWEQLELIQTTYNIMAELLVLVQSTSSYMVAQQQQLQKTVSSGVASATVTNTTSSAQAATALAVSIPTASMGSQRSRTSSRGRGFGNGGGGADSDVSSVVSTPRMGPVEALGGAPSSLSTTAPPASSADRHATTHSASRRHRLLSLFTAKRRGDTPTTPSESAESGSRPSGLAHRRHSLTRKSPYGESEGGFGATNRSAQATADDTDADAEGAGGGTMPSPSPAGAAPPSSREVTTVVIDLRGTVALRDRLEGHTTAHHLATQALKQWEGLAADRRLRNGTIVKEIAKPLTAIVMEDMGNDYIAGIYSFYRCASKAHRDTVEGRRCYVEWAVAVKELESQVWRRVRLPFLHTALRSALNEVLVVEPHRSILLDRRFGLRALLEEWSASLKSNDLTLAPQVSASGTGGNGGGSGNNVSAAPTTANTAAVTARNSLNKNSFSISLPSHGQNFSRAVSDFVQAPVQVGLRSAKQHFNSSFPRPCPSVSCFDQPTHQGFSQIPLSITWGERTAGAALSAVRGGNSERFEERVGAWVGVGHATGQSAQQPITTATAAAAAAAATATNAQHSGATSAAGNSTRTSLGAANSTSSVSAPSSASHTNHSSQQQQQEKERPPLPHVQSTTDQNGAAAVAAAAAAAAAALAQPPAVEALRSLYGLFSDVTEDECFVLMAAVLITNFIRDAAHLFEDYISKTTTAAADEPGNSSRRTVVGSPTGAPAHSSNGSAAMIANAGAQLMTALVDLIEQYTELVETVFQSQPILHSALDDALEEIMRPTRWTKKGSLQAAQQRAQETLMATAAAADAAAAAVTTGMASSLSDDGGGVNFANVQKTDLPSVLLSRDARHATLPLVSLATAYPQAVQQLKLSVLLARYADVFLQQERVGGRVVSGGIFRRLRLLGRLVSLLEDKDVFLEHYRLCLARRLLGTSGSAAPTPASPGREHDSASSGLLNIEAERQLVSCLQSYLGATGTHAFEAMLRDYEGTQRTRGLFEQEPAFAKLTAKIRVQLITSAQWPMYTILPLTPHVSLQKGMDVFRGYYARLHPSRTLLWVFSLGTATLTAEVASGTKHIVASTLLATLLLVVSDAYNARPRHAGSITGSQIAQKVGMPFQALRTHLHLLSQHRAFNLLCWTPASAETARATAASSGAAAAAMTENDSFTLNPAYTHKLRKIRLPLPKIRLTGLPSSEAAADRTMSPMAEGGADRTAGNPTAVGVAVPESEDAVVSRHVNASRRLLLDTALVRVFKSRRVVLFEDLFQAVTAQLSRQFVPSRRDVKAQLEGLIDRDYVRRSADGTSAFVYVS